MAFHGNMQVAVAEARNLVEQGNRVVFFAPSTGELERLADIFQEYSRAVPARHRSGRRDAAVSGRALLHGGFGGQHVSGERTGAARRRVSGMRASPSSAPRICSTPPSLIAKPGPSKSQLAAFTADLADLKPGDYVVHVTHGVGRFLGMREIAQGENKGDFMLLEYAGEAKLYVPLTRMDLVQKFRGAGEGAAPPLDRLGGATWERTKSRVKAKMRDMADELLKLYAQRRMADRLSSFRPTPTGSASSRTPSNSPRPRISSPP